MSAIFGIVNRDGQPVRAAEIEAMRAVSSQWGPDESETWIQGAAALGYCARHFTPEDVTSRPPRCEVDEDVAFTAEGRLDNRDELFLALGIPPGDRHCVSDTELMRRAYAAWGDGAPDRLLGDWSLAAWHARDRRLFLARDHFGQTALHYAVSPHTFAFASSIRALLALPWVDRGLNELKFAGHLVSWRVHGTDTFFNGIALLPPAHDLVVTPEAITTHRYWRMEDVPEISLPTDQEYVEAFLQTYEEAVRCRLRGTGSIAATLSGGLDSSSVAAIAARQLRPASGRLQAYTWVPAYECGQRVRGRIHDEGPLAADVARFAGNIDVHRITGGVDPLAAIRHMVAIQAAPVVAAGNAPWVDETHRAAVEAGARVLLTGVFGNATVSWIGLGPQHWRHDVRARLRPWIPAALARVYRGARQRPRVWPLRYAPLHPDFVRRLDLDRRLTTDSSYQALFHTPPDSRAARLQILFPDSLTTGAHWAALEGHYGISPRAPTMDKRVIELCLGIPDRVFSGKDRQNRWLIRQAMRGLLPDSVRLNRKRGQQGSDLAARLRSHASSIETALDEAEATPVVRERLDVERMRTAWDSVRNTSGQETWTVAMYSLLNGLQAASFLATEVQR